MSETTKSIEKRVFINNDLDIIVARLRAREVARSMGFGTIDQARISLAAGELARILTKNMDEQGEVIISDVRGQNHIGIQVISVNPKGAIHPQPPADQMEDDWGNQDLSSVLSLVDEGFIEHEDEQSTRVTLKKWLG